MLQAATHSAAWGSRKAHPPKLYKLSDMLEKHSMTSLDEQIRLVSYSLVLTWASRQLYMTAIVSAGVQLIKVLCHIARD